MAVMSVVKLSEASNYHRLDSEFYQPQYFINFSKGIWKPIKKFLDICQYGISQAMIEEPKGYPIFRMDDIKDTFLLDDEVKYIEIPEEIFENFKLNVNDILFNRVNAEEFVGRTGIFKLKGNFVFASYLIRLRVKPNSGIFPEYLNVFLNTKFGKKQIFRFSRRAVNQANVNANELKNFKIAILPSPFQKQISQLVNEAWEKFEISKSLYSQAESLLLSELGLQDFKPEDRLSYEVSLSEARTVHRIDAEYFNPSYEEVINKIKNYKNGYGKLLTFAENIKPKFEPQKFPQKNFSYVELADINASIGVIQSSTNINSEEAPSRAKRILKKNDVIVSSVEGSLEKVALVDEQFEDSLASTGFFQFRSKNILPEVLLVLAKSPVIQTQLKKECAGTILTAVPKEAIKKLIIPDLPKPIQTKIASLVQQSHEARRKAKELLETAKKAVEIAIEKDENEALDYIYNINTSWHFG